MAALQGGGKRARKALWTAAALGAGLWLRVWFIHHAPVIAGDALVYGDIAKNLLRHGVYGFSMAGGTVRPTLLRLPGYPLFLAGCFGIFGLENYRAAMYMQAAVDVATCVLVARTARRLFDARAGWAGLVLAALCPFTANYTAVALTETLSIFCVAAAFYAAVRWEAGGCGLDRWMGMVGGALAYAVLLRPEQGLLAAAVIPAMAWRVWQRGRRDFWRRLAPVVAAGMIVATPLAVWAGRNWRTFHVVEPLAPRNANDPGEAVPVGFQRWFRTWGVDFISTDQVYWHYDNDPILVTDLPSRAFDSDDQHRRTDALLEDYNQTTTATAALDARFWAVADERIKAGWWRYHVGLPLARLGNMLFRPRTELLPNPLDWWHWRAGWEMAVGFGLLNLAYFGLAGWGFYREREVGIASAMVAFCVLRCALLTTIDNSEPRYTLELFPVLMVFAAGALRRLF